MKKLIIFYSIVMATALNVDASSSSSNNKSKNKQSTQKKALTAILPESIKIPGKRGKAFEKVNLDAQDHISKMSFRKHINEMHKEYNLPWIMAAFWWKQDDGSLARDYASAVEFNSWRLNDKHQVVNKLHPLHQRKIVCPEYYAFEPINKKLTVEYLGTEKQLINKSVFLQLIFFISKFPKKEDDTNNTPSGASCRVIGNTYRKKGNAKKAIEWLSKAANRGNTKCLADLAKLYEENNDDNNALKIYKRIMKDYTNNNQQYNQPRYQEYLDKIGDIYLRAKNIPQALHWYKQEAQNSPYNLNGRFRILELYWYGHSTEVKNIIDHDSLKRYARRVLIQREFENCLST